MIRRRDAMSRAIGASGANVFREVPKGESWLEGDGERPDDHVLELSAPYLTSSITRRISPLDQSLSGDARKRSSERRHALSDCNSCPERAAPV